MALFEEMLDAERCMAYLKYRESRGETDGRLQGMREYLLRGTYTEDVRRLARGEYTLSVPVRKEIPEGYTDRKRTVYHFTEDEMTLLRMMAFVLHGRCIPSSGGLASRIWSGKSAAALSCGSSMW